MKPGRGALHRGAPATPRSIRPTAPRADAEIMLRKNWSAIGLLRQGRPAARARSPRLREPAGVQHLPQQLPGRPRASRRRRPDLRRGARSQPRHGRLLLGRSAACCRSAMCRWRFRALPARSQRKRIGMGCKALMVPSACPPGHSPSHIGLFPVWAAAQEAGVPVVFHVGGGGRSARPELLRRTACRR